MTLTREQIMERLQTENSDVTNVHTALFDEVPENKMRYVVGIFISGDGVQGRTVDFEMLKEDGDPEEDDDYIMKFSDIPIAPADHRELPESGYDIENPIVVFEGGTRLYGKSSAGTLNITVIFWDSEI